MGGPAIAHYHQAIGLVVKELFGQARAAAALVQVDYVKQAGRFDLAAALPTAAPSGKTSLVGDFGTAFAGAPVRLDAHYTTPDQSHA